MKHKALASFAAGITLAVSMPVFAQQSGWFRDVSGDTYFSSAVENMSRIGIIKGYNDGRFGPNDVVTRAQVAVMFDRYDQSVVEPMREEIAEMREELGLPPSDTVRCEGKYAVGETYRAADGCNTCTCMSNGGSACTKMACVDTPKKCLSSNQCGSGEYCTTEDGDCSSYCDDDAGACIGACAGICKPKAQMSCDDELKTYEQIIDEGSSCKTNSDCEVFTYACPFLTCGQPLNKNLSSQAQRAAEAYATCKQNSGEPLACAMCMQMETACVRGKCVQK